MAATVQKRKGGNNKENNLAEHGRCQPGQTIRSCDGREEERSVLGLLWGNLGLVPGLDDIEVEEVLPAGLWKICQRDHVGLNLIRVPSFDLVRLLLDVHRFEALLKDLLLRLFHGRHLDGLRHKVFRQRFERDMLVETDVGPEVNAEVVYVGGGEEVAVG